MLSLSSNVYGYYWNEWLKQLQPKSIAQFAGTARNESLRNIDRWIVKHRLKLAPEKTEVVILRQACTT